MTETGHNPSIVAGWRRWYHIFKWNCACALPSIVAGWRLPSIVAGWSACTSFRALKCDGHLLRAWALVLVSSAWPLDEIRKHLQCWKNVAFSCVIGATSSRWLWLTLVHYSSWCQLSSIQLILLNLFNQLNDSNQLIQVNQLHSTKQ